jgi:hypothetical protein
MDSRAITPALEVKILGMILNQVLRFKRIFSRIWYLPPF